MNSPKISFDWTINVTSLITIAVFISAFATAWYNLKMEVAVDKAVSDVRFAQMDKSIEALKAEMTKNATEIKGDIKDLRLEVLSTAAAARAH